MLSKAPTLRQYRGKGKHGDSDKSEEDYETREETRAAATYGTDAAVQQALKSKQQVCCSPDMRSI